MALTYEQSAALMKDSTFVSRIKVACLHYAAFIFAEIPSTPAHVTRTKWAQSVFDSPDGVSQQIAPHVVMDPAVQQDGAAITDAALQGAVEATVNSGI